MKWKIYKKIPRFEVSDTGKVRNLKTKKTIKVAIDKYGYKRLSVIIGSRTDKTRKHLNIKIHRMVAETFLGRPTINHKDNNKLNNRVENLEWCSFAENTHKAWKDGLFKNAKVGRPRIIK